jgi:hypothetical protein
MVGSTTLEERFFSMKRYLGLLEYDQKQRELKSSFKMYNRKLNTSK